MGFDSVIERVGNFLRDFLGGDRTTSPAPKNKKEPSKMNRNRFHRVVKKTVIRVFHTPNRRRRR